MARIAGVDLPREKRVEIGLTYIYGIGRTRRSNYFCDFVRRIATDEVWRSVAYNH